jgi:PKD repeat protein
VTVSVGSGNRAPVADEQSVTTAEDTAKAITLTGSDADGDLLTFIIVSNPTKGTLSGTGANRTYTPNLNYNGSDSFTFKVNDGQLDSNIATVSIAVTAVNDAPVANNQSVTTAEDTAKAITLTGSDVDGDPLTFIIVSNPTKGTLSGTGASRTYTPNLNYNGSDSFTFKVNDGKVDSNIATVSITVTAVNDNPTVAASATPTSGTAPLTVNFTANGQDVDGDVLSYAWTFGDGGTSAMQNPGYTYNAAGTYVATVTVSDGKGGTATASVTITVAAPVSYTITASAGTGGTINPSGSVTVSHGSSQTFAIAANAGYALADVKVDNVSVGAVSSYSFSNVTANHTIAASFSALAQPYAWVSQINLTVIKSGVNYNANGEAYVADQNGLAVSGATVTVEWSGAVKTSTATATTDASGKAAFASAKVKNKTGPFTLTVKNVTASGLPYDPTKNAMTSVSATYGQETVLLSGGAPEDVENISAALSLGEQVGAFEVKNLVLKVDFRKENKDMVVLHGFLTMGADFSVEGKTAIVDVGGATWELPLDGKGKGKEGGALVQVKAGKVDKEAVTVRGKLTFKANKQDLAGDWADEGLTDEDSSGKSATVAVAVTIGGQVFAATKQVTYRAKAGKNGLAK